MSTSRKRGSYFGAIPAKNNGTNEPHITNNVTYGNYLSTVTTAGCYATDMEQHLSKVGNHRQLTNNYRRAGPDSCSAPWKELLFHFYEMTPFS